MAGFAHRALASASRRLGRPELLALIDVRARREIRDHAAIPAMLAATLRPDSSFVDVGTNEGQWLPHVLRCAPHGRHLAFEPSPHLAAGLRRDFPNVTVHQAAVSDEAGEVDFHYFAGLTGLSGLRRSPQVDEEPEVIRVRATRLDDAIGDVAPAVIKIDVEGHELAALRGARHTIAAHRPLIVFEHVPEACALYETTSDDIWAFLHDAGMRVFDVQGGGPYERYDPDPAREMIDWLAVPA